MIHSEESAVVIEGRSQALLTIDMPPSALVVEGVSPKQENRDQRHRRTEYAARYTPEYWIVDSTAARVIVLEWADGLYEEQIYQDSDQIVSPHFPELHLTAAQILSAGRQCSC